MSLRLRGFGLLLVVISLTGCLINKSTAVDTETTKQTNIEDNAEPIISGLPLQLAIVSQEYRFTPVAKDPDGDTLQFMISNLPAWAQFDSDTGELTGTPATADIDVYNNVSISVSDGENISSLPPFGIVVISNESVADNIQKQNNAPTLSGTPPTTVVIGNTYDFTPISFDADGDELLFQISRKPIWANFNTTTGQLTGIPTETDKGDYEQIVIAASDSNTIVSLRAFTIRVVSEEVENNAPQIEGQPDTTVSAGTQYSFVPSAQDLDGDNLLFMIAGLPAWAKFDSITGELYGIPNEAQIGEYPGVKIYVNDGDKFSSLPDFTITVVATTENSDIPELDPIPGGEAVDSSPPTIPGTPQVVSAGQSTATFNWTASTDDTAVVGYRIYRNNVEVTTTTSLMFSDSGLNASSSYQYAISAYDAAGNESAKSSQLTVTTSAKVVGSCGEKTGSAVAIPFKFVTPMNVGKYITLAATSTRVEFNIHSVDDVPNINWSRRYKAYKYGNGGAAIDVWKIDVAPANGTLYEKLNALSDGDTVTDPDDLTYVPNNNYIGADTFSYCVFDSTGQSNIAEVTIQVAPTDNYPMPYGIKAPGFGIDEQPPADPPEWPSAEKTGFYYIDSDHPACSNDSNYGYPDAPRCSIPGSGASIAAGGKMVLAISSLPYTLRDSSWQQIHFQGTVDNPSWLIGNDKGPDKPIIKTHTNRTGSRVSLRITGGNLRISGIVFDGPNLDHRGGGVNNVVVRHTEFKNYPSTAGGGTTVGLSTDGQNVLAFNVYAHDNGIVDEEGLSRERDIHAFVGSNQQGYWILDSRCDENAGDCVQLTNNNTTSDVFVGRMVAHSDGENCVDIKDFNRVVVSESDCWDIRQVRYGNSGGNAQNFYVNDEGVQQNYVYMLNNRSWDTGGTNYGASNIGGKVYMIGNVSFASPQANGFTGGSGSGSRYIYFNTFVGSEIGIYHYGSGSSMDRYIVGNVIDDMSLYNTRLQSATGIIDMLDYNFYVQSNAFASGGSSANIHQNLAAFSAALGFSENSAEGIEADYLDKANYNFTPSATSELSKVIPATVIESLPLINDLASDLQVPLQDRSGKLRSESVSRYDAGAFRNAN